MEAFSTRAKDIVCPCKIHSIHSALNHLSLVKHPFSEKKKLRDALRFLETKHCICDALLER